MTDALGDRMKSHYEHRTRYQLPRRTYTIVRLDGKAFHGYTRDLDRPYDERLTLDLGETARFLCESVQGVRFAYQQSDEISLLLTDLEGPTTEAWFDGGIQKICSVTASLATARFNELRPGKLAFFDSRVFTIPDPIEVVNYFVWRQQDATRNSILSAGQAHFPHRELQGVSTDEVQERLFQDAGVNWNDYDPRFKRGTAVTPHVVVDDVRYTDKRTGEERVAPDVERRVWRVAAPPIFTQDKPWITSAVLGAPVEEVIDL